MDPSGPQSPAELIAEATEALTAALRHAWQVCEQVNPRPVLAGTNLPEILAEALQTLARELGMTEALVAHRRGSWEAAHVRRLGSLLDDEPW